jgi:RNA polymerase sigma-70 factor, ECF subfamily
MDEAELIIAARRGDQDAFAELHRKYIRYVRAIGRSILRSNDLEDMCQDTFLLAFTRLDSFKGDASFRTWISRIAVNRCLVILRDGQRRADDKSHRVAMDEGLAEPAVGIHGQLEGITARLDLEKLLRVLRPHQQKLLEMAYLEEMPDVEIAEALGTSLVAVKCRLYQAKRKVRNARNQS